MRDPLEYFDEKMADIGRNYRLALDGDHEGVHDLRVDLKRLRAFFRIVGGISGDFDADGRFKPFRAIARATRTLRDVHVQRGLFERIVKNKDVQAPGYRVYLVDVEQGEFEALRVFAERDRLGKCAARRKHIAAMLEAEDPVGASTRAVGRFLNLKNRLMLAHTGAWGDDADLHRVRILAKEVHYALEIVTDCFAPMGMVDEFIGGIKKVHGALGKWHDCEVGARFCADYRDATPVAADEGIRVFVRMLGVEKRRLRRTFIARYDEFLPIAASII